MELNENMDLNDDIILCMQSCQVIRGLAMYGLLHHITIMAS